MLRSGRYINKGSRIELVSKANMVGLVTLSCQSHARRLMEGIWTNFQNNFGTDFEVCVSGNDGLCHSLAAHHVILSIFCPTLLNLTDKKINIDDQTDVGKEDVNALLEFIYRGKIRVDEDRLPHLKRGADVIGLSALTNIIDKYLESKMISHNKNTTVKELSEENSSVLPPKRKRKLTEAGQLLKETLNKNCKKNTNMSRRSKKTEIKTKSKLRKPTDSMLQFKGPTVSKKPVRSPFVKLEKLPIIQVQKLPDEPSSKPGETSRVLLKQRILFMPMAFRKTITKEKHLERLKNMLKHLQVDKQLVDDDEKAEETSVEKSQPPLDTDTREESTASSNAPSNGKKSTKKPKDGDISLSPWLKQKILELGDEQTAVYRYDCELCGQLQIGFFRQLRHLQCHENPDLILKCKYCDFQAEMEIDLNRHLASVHELDCKGEPLPKNIRCADCDFCCIKKAQLRTHRATAHRSLKYRCDECSETFPYRLSLVQHQTDVHNRTKLPHLCATCGFTTDDIAEFQQHLKEHDPHVVSLDQPVVATYEEVGQIFEVPQDAVTVSEVIVVPQETVVETQKIDGVPIKTDKGFSCHLCNFTASVPFSLKFHFKTLHKMPASEAFEICKNLKN